MDRVQTYIFDDCGYIYVVFSYVSIDLLFVLSSGWSVGSDKEDASLYAPPNTAVWRAGNPPSGPAAPGDQKHKVSQSGLLNLYI